MTFLGSNAFDRSQMLRTVVRRCPLPDDYITDVPESGLGCRSNLFFSVHQLKQSVTRETTRGWSKQGKDNLNRPGNRRQMHDMANSYNGIAHNAIMRVDSNLGTPLSEFGKNWKVSYVSGTRFVC